MLVVCWQFWLLGCLVLMLADVGVTNCYWLLGVIYVLLMSVMAWFTDCLWWLLFIVGVAHVLTLRSIVRVKFCRFLLMFIVGLVLGVVEVHCWCCVDVRLCCWVLGWVVLLTVVGCWVLFRLVGVSRCWGKLLMLVVGCGWGQLLDVVCQLVRYG